VQPGTNLSGKQLKFSCVFVFRRFESFDSSNDTIEQAKLFVDFMLIRKCGYSGCSQGTERTYLSLNYLGFSLYRFYCRRNLIKKSLVHDIWHFRFVAFQYILDAANPIDR